MALAAESLERLEPYRIRLSHLVTLNRNAVEGLEREPGAFRTEGMVIHGSRHEPPAWQEVPRLVEDMLDYVNTNSDKPPIHLAAYLVWRINWIHPFYDGNGRTARMVAYMDLCIRLGARLPGRNTVPDQIVANKRPYYRALEAADQGYSEGGVDVSAVEQPLSATLAAQFMAALRQAEGKGGAH